MRNNWYRPYEVYSPERRIDLTVRLRLAFPQPPAKAKRKQTRVLESRNDLANHSPMNIGQAEVPSTETIGELFVIEPQEVQDRGV